MRKLCVFVAVLLTVMAGASPASARTHHHFHSKKHSTWDTSSTWSSSSSSDDTAVTTPAAVQVQLTGYGAPDNTPAGSRTISMPTVHEEAGGNCTYGDPVTFASPGKAGSTEFPRGERVYFPKLRCYGISEDSGATKESLPHIDIYTGDGPKGVTDECEQGLTGETSVIVSPPPGEPVNPGPLSSPSGCSFSKMTSYNSREYNNVW
jgi:hypothetical protein